MYVISTIRRIYSSLLFQVGLQKRTIFTEPLTFMLNPGD